MGTPRRKPRITLPLFVYGFLRPGEIAYPRIEDLVASIDHARINGRLWLRDGLLLLERADASSVEGFLLHFGSDQAEIAYRRIDALEPYDLYRWDTSEVSVGADVVEANVLLGKSPRSGSESWDAEEWRVADDPLFNEALQEIESISAEPRPDDPTEPRTFFRKQMAYLLLWTSIERYVSLRRGFAGGPMQRVLRLAEEPAFDEALMRFVGRKDRVRRTDDPTQSEVLDRTKPVIPSPSV